MHLSNLYQKNFYRLRGGSMQVIISIISLAFAFTCFLFVIFWFSYELNYDTFYKNSQRIYLINQKNEVSSSMMKVTPYPLFRKLKEDFPEVEKSTVCQQLQLKALINKEGMEFIQIEALKVDTSFFHLFPQHFLCGNIDNAFKSGRGIILTKSLALQIFGKVEVNGQYEELPFPISGVVTDPPQNTTLPFKILLPWNDTNHNLQSWNNSNYLTFILLSKHSSPKDFEKKLKSSFSSIPGQELKRTFNLVPLKKVKYISEGQSFLSAYVFQITSAIAASLLLLNAIFNFIMLTIARFLSRRKEYSIRKILGAESSHIIIMQYKEIIITSLIAFGLSFILFEILQPLFFDFTNVTSSTKELFSHATKYAAICLIIILTTNLYPVIHTSALSLHKTLSSLALSTKKTQINKNLIGIQLVITIISFFSLLE